MILDALAFSLSIGDRDRTLYPLSRPRYIRDVALEGTAEVGLCLSSFELSSSLADNSSASSSVGSSRGTGLRVR